MTKTVRVSGRRNDDYAGVWVFDNDHPCVAPTAPTELDAPPGIYRSRPATGLSRVVCFTPRHDLTLAELPHAEVVALLRALQAQYRELVVFFWRLPLFCVGESSTIVTRVFTTRR